MEIPKPLVKPPALTKYGKVVKPWREGRGFSIGELKQVGLNPKEAMKMGLRVDKRRKSIHEENVRILKEYLTKAKK